MNLGANPQIVAYFHYQVGSKGTNTRNSNSRLCGTICGADALKLLVICSIRNHEN